MDVNEGTKKEKIILVKQWSQHTKNLSPSKELLAVAWCLLVQLSAGSGCPEVSKALWYSHKMVADIIDLT